MLTPSNLSQANWDAKCKTDRRWCASFFKLLINKVLLSDLFPKMTMPTVKGDIRKAILAECKGNWKCFDKKMHLQRSGLLQDYLVDKYAVSTRDSARATLIGCLVGGLVLLPLILLAIVFLVKRGRTARSGGHPGANKLHSHSGKSLGKSKSKGSRRTNKSKQSKQTLKSKHSKTTGKYSKRSKQSKASKQSKTKRPSKAGAASKASKGASKRISKQSTKKSKK